MPIRLEKQPSIHSVNLRDPYLTQIGFSNFWQVLERNGAP
jgi:hypothetical protein